MPPVVARELSVPLMVREGSGARSRESLRV
jgi:hypothetical protein